MSGFTLETGGCVYVGTDTTQPGGHIEWSDLTPFAQGTLAAMFAGPATWTEGRCLTVLGEWAGFSDLHPTALEMSLRRCAAIEGGRFDVKGRQYTHDRAAGAAMWAFCQKGDGLLRYGDGFGPFTVFLDDEGKVRVASVADIAAAGPSACAATGPQMKSEGGAS